MRCINVDECAHKANEMWVHRVEQAAIPDFPNKAKEVISMISSRCRERQRTARDFKNC